jgi:hypothetical protein
MIVQSVSKRNTKQHSDHIRPSESVLAHHPRAREMEQNIPKLMMTSACSTFKQPVTYEVWKDIPSTYLICELDNAIPVAAQVCLDGQNNR